DMLFHEKRGYNEYQIKLIADMYKLPTIRQEIMVHEDFFHHIVKKKFFIILLLYDGNGRICLKHSEGGFELPGGSIHDHETIQDCINRLTKEINNDILISDVMPIYTVINDFRSTNNYSHEHIGLVYFARIRSKVSLSANFNTHLLVHASHIDIDAFTKFSNKTIIEHIIKDYNLYIIGEAYNTQDLEIDTNEKYSFRYIIHNYLMKPMLRYFDTGKQNMKQHLIDYIKEYSKVLDVSCGDDSLLIDTICHTESNIQLAVGNDISRSQIALLSQLYKKYINRIIFTNHNATALPFASNFFDIVLCKNTLHHMPDKKSLQKLLQYCFDVGKEIVFVEIENPLSTGGFSYKLHKYRYRGFLKDVGGAYMTRECFMSIIKTHYEGLADIDFNVFQTLQGSFMVAYIKKRSINV
ncbi:MAG TPA: methyltransferase domain-containing protein, partial [Candidatus Absconditabacterales bacterium]|nr:methyltransferase domain-containing protein [Candidatus Absconditabacterales bacterium]